MNFLQKIFKDTVIYSFILIFSKATNYLLLPFLTKYITATNLGIIYSIYADIGILNIVYSYGMETTYFRFGKEKNKQFKTLLIFSTALFSVIFFFLKDFYTYKEYASYVILLLAVEALSVIPFVELKNDRKLKKYSLYKFIQVILNVFLVIIFVKYLKIETVRAYLLANIFSNTFVLLFLKPFSFVKIENQDMISWLSFGIPLMFMGLVGELNGKWWSIKSLHFFLPEDFYPGLSKTAMIGVIGTCSKISTIVLICIQSFRSAFDAMIFKKENDSEQIHKQTMHYFVIVISFIWFAISINKKLIADIFIKNDILNQGLIFVPIIAFGHLCNGIYYTICIFFKKMNKTIYNFVFSLISLLVNVILSILLIPYFGFIGGLIANIFGIILVTILAYLKNDIKYDLKDLAWIFIPVVLVFIHDNFIKNYFISMLLTGIYFCCVLLFLYRTDSFIKNFLEDKILKKIIK